MIFGDIDGFTSNEYWAPQVTNCGLCQLNYTFIGNVRTFADDSQYLLQRLKVDDFGVDHQDRTDTFDVLKQFTGIDLEIRRKLFAIFKQDYEAFNFPSPTYLGI